MAELVSVIANAGALGFLTALTTNARGATQRDSQVQDDAETKCGTIWSQNHFPPDDESTGLLCTRAISCRRRDEDLSKQLVTQVQS
jgi:hypothetical protein